MSKTLSILQLIIAVTLIAGCASPAPQARPTDAKPQANAPAGVPAIDRRGYLSRDDVQAFARAVSQNRQIPLPEVTALLGQANQSTTAIRLMTPAEPGQARSVRDWVRYRGNFVEPIRIRKGRAFLRRTDKHSHSLKIAMECLQIS